MKLFFCYFFCHDFYEIRINRQSPSSRRWSEWRCLLLSPGWWLHNMHLVSRVVELGLHGDLLVFLTWHSRYNVVVSTSHSLFGSFNLLGLLNHRLVEQYSISLLLAFEQMQGTLGWLLLLLGCGQAAEEAIGVVDNHLFALPFWLRWPFVSAKEWVTSSSQRGQHIEDPLPVAGPFLQMVDQPSADVTFSEVWSISMLYSVRCLHFKLRNKIMQSTDAPAALDNFSNDSALMRSLQEDPSYANYLNQKV